jgi:hypothetical protein
MQMTVSRDPTIRPRTFQCQIVRQKNLVPQLVLTALTNSVDMEGDLPEELTAEMEARFEFQERPPLIVRDVYSGSSYAGGRAPLALFSQIASLVHALSYHPFEPVPLQRIVCETRISTGRNSAEIEAVELLSECYCPGETVKGIVFLKPYKGTRQRVPIQLELPRDLPPGSYTATICDDLTNVRYQLRDSPTLSNPSNIDQLFEALRLQACARRTNVVVRVAISETGVALDGQALPDLPASIVEMLGNSRRTGAQTMNDALISRHPTQWVIQGMQTVKFTVSKNKRLSIDG